MALCAELSVMSPLSTSPAEVTKETNLFDGWLTSEGLFALERRAIFSKTWFCVTHCSRFAKPGDYISFALADFTMLLILSKDKIIRAFHNVCRHRAYAVTKKTAGSSLVLRCRYHGWTYDSKGKLLKAPQFDEIDGFEKSENSLFSIHTCTDRAGFVYINLDAERNIQPPDLKGLHDLALGTGLKAGSKWLTGWSLDGAFNWKVFSSYDDQSAVSTPAPPSLASLIPRIFYKLFRKSHFSTENCKTFAWAPGTVVFTFRPSPLWATATALPISATQTTVQLEVFSTVDVTLEESTVKNIKAFFEAYVEGLEQRCEKLIVERWKGEAGQTDILRKHQRMEREVGREVLPARPRPEKGESEAFCKAEQVCWDLDIMAKTSAARGRVDSVGDLEW